MQEFIAVLEKVANMDATYVIIPFDVEKLYGKKGQVKVKATIDGEFYRGGLAKMQKNAPHLLIVTQAIRKKINKVAGDKVKVFIELDKEERVLIVPEDLQKEFKENKVAKIFFEKLSYTNRKEYIGWIESAKKIETRLDRVNKTIQKLLQEKKNPSCKGVSR